MSQPTDATWQSAEHRVVTERRQRATPPIQVRSVADQRREHTLFWSMIVTSVVATIALVWIGRDAGAEALTLRLAALISTAIALVFSARAALGSELDSAERRFWRYISGAMLLAVGAALLMFLAAFNGWTIVLRYREALHLLPQLAVLLAMLQLPGAPKTLVDRYKLLLDATTVIVGGLILAWYDVLTSRALPSAAPLVDATLQYGAIILDLSILLVASVLWMRTSSTRQSNMLGLIATGVFVHMISFVTAVLARRLDEPSISLPIGAVAVSFFAVAAWVQRNGIGKVQPYASRFFRTCSAISTLIPYVAVLPSFLLLLRVAHAQDAQPLGGLAVGAVLLAILSFARQVASTRETIRLSTETMARDGEARFSALVQHSSDVITIVDIDGTIRFVSPSVAGVLGYEPKQIEGMLLSELLHEDDIEGAETFLDELAARNATHGERRSAGSSTLKREWRIRHADGSWHTVDNVGTNLLDEPQIRGLVLNTRDVTEQSVIREQYMHQAFHDPLTDLANRSLFLYQVGHALARSQRQGHRVSVLFLDLDNFKNVNDSLGHAAGDRLLVEAARRLAACVRDSDLIARLGGDEFAVLLEDVDADDHDTSTVAERIGNALAAPFLLGGKEVFVSASIGIARTCTGETSDELVRNADVAMYVAKTNGKGKHVLFEPAMHHAALERLVVEADLRRAIEREEFFLEFQPIVILQTGEICGAEALVRWQCRERGTVPPGVFIPIAEETGLVVPLGRYVLRSACRSAAKWTREHGRPLRITVNLSGRQLQEASIVDHVREALLESELPPQNLVLEITESMLMQNNDISMARLMSLKALGVSLAIDDFGTGYSSLSYLQRYPVDILKIDKAFVDLIDKGGDGLVLASAIVALGETLRMNTVAEGIETEAQRGQLLQLGCDLGQGFLFAPPLGIEDFTRLAISRGVRSPLSMRRRIDAHERAA